MLYHMMGGVYILIAMWLLYNIVTMILPHFMAIPLPITLHYFVSISVTIISSHHVVKTVAIILYMVKL